MKRRELSTSERLLKAQVKRKWKKIIIVVFSYMEASGNSGKSSFSEVENLDWSQLKSDKETKGPCHLY